MEKKYEEKVERLAKINQELREAKLPIDDLIKLFEEGVTLFRECKMELEGYKLQVDHVIAEMQNGEIEE